MLLSARPSRCSLLPGADCAVIMRKATMKHTCFRHLHGWQIGVNTTLDDLRLQGQADPGRLARKKKHGRTQDGLMTHES
jgi:hypothetical protein